MAELNDSSYGYMSIYNYNLELVGDADKEYVVYVKKGTVFQDPGYIAEDRNGNKLDALVTGIVDVNTVATYYLTYTLEDISLRRKVIVYDEVYNFDYTGNYQVFTVPISGTYKIELWGASGGRSYTTASKGGYTSGDCYLNEKDIFYIYVGEAGSLGTVGVDDTSTVGQGASATFNGGGKGGNAGGGDYPYSYYRGGASGGGATDIRLVSGVWNNVSSLRSRMMVAGGGGGTSTGTYNYDNDRGNAGGLIGEKGGVQGYLNPTYEHHVPMRGVGGTQTTGNAFGIGGAGSDSGSTGYCNGHNGAGGGYYGGTGGQSTGGACHSMEWWCWFIIYIRFYWE